MEKNLLIAVDGSCSADIEREYVGLMEEAMIRKLKVTLFHIMPDRLRS